MKKFLYIIVAMFVALAMISCSDDSGVNVIDFDENGDDNGNGGDEPGMVYSIEFDVEGGGTFTFSVDMTDAVIEGDDLPDDFDGDILEFDPDAHRVFIAGGMVDWPQPGSEPGLEMTTSGGSFGTAIPEGPAEYKYFLVPAGVDATWEYGEWEGGDNRETDVTSGGSVTNVWADAAPEPGDEPEPGDFPESLFVPGGYQGASGYGDDWTPADAPEIGSPSAGEYSGFVYFAEGGVFKFSNAANWDEGDWGGVDGTLSAGGADIEDITEAGYYRLTANLDELTYSATSTVWSVIGDAANGWDDGDDVEMDFDAEDKTWSVTLDLSDDGEFKFRANAAWDLNMGLGDEDGELFYDGGNLAVDEAGSYTVTIDLNGTTYTYDVAQN